MIIYQLRVIIDGCDVVVSSFDNPQDALEERNHIARLVKMIDDPTTGHDKITSLHQMGADKSEILVRPNKVSAIYIKRYSG